MSFDKDTEAVAARSINRAVKNGTWPADAPAPVDRTLARRAAERIAHSNAVAGRIGEGKALPGHTSDADRVRAKAYILAGDTAEERERRERMIVQNEAKLSKYRKAAQDGTLVVRNMDGTVLFAGHNTPLARREQTEAEGYKAMIAASVKRLIERVRRHDPADDPGVIRFLAEDEARRKAQAEADANWEAIQAEARARANRGLAAAARDGRDVVEIIIGPNMTARPSVKAREAQAALDAEAAARRQAERDAKAADDARVEVIRRKFIAEGKVPPAAGAPQQRPSS